MYQINFIYIYLAIRKHKSINQLDIATVIHYLQIVRYYNDVQTAPLDLSNKPPQSPSNIRRSMSVNDLLPSLHDSVAKIYPILGSSNPIDYRYKPVMIIIPPKTQWHYRSIKDLAKNHIPLLSGDGPQRTPIRVTQSSQPMYLCIEVVTCDYQPHDSKVIVPHKTRVRADQLTHDNNLHCLNFNECNSTDYFDPVRKHVYLQITAEEHRAQLKE
ncbi:unnamed protein product [Rotaria sp. Silwood2]|nr:unnamed protein product [Rotaria sp. Silwood2]CAF4452404.1 unnamed protein product [Rotaria sp. Silwood2]